MKNTLKITLKTSLLLAVGLLSSAAFASDCPAGRMYEHTAGKTCVANVPQRIVVLEYSFIDNLGVLGKKPVGYAKDAMPEYLNPIVAGATEVGARKAPSLEKIVTLKPDLIIADKKRHTAIYDKLSAIAPTLVQNSLRGNYDDQMANLKQLADITKQNDVAAKAIADLEQKIADSKTNAKHNTVIVGVFRPGAIHAHSDQSFMGSFVERIGKLDPMKVQDGQTQYVIDIEGIAAINPDAIVMMCTEKSQQAFDELLKQPVFAALKAVKNNNLYVVSKNLWSKGRAVLGLNHIIDNAKENGFLANTASTNIGCID